MGKQDRRTLCQGCNRLGAGIDRRHSTLALAARHVLPWSRSRWRWSRAWVPPRCSSRAGAVGPRRPRERVDVWARVDRGRGSAPRFPLPGFWRRPPPRCAGENVGCYRSRFGRRHAPWALPSGTACDQSPPLRLVSGGTRSYVCRRRCTTIRAFACTRDISRGRGGARTFAFWPCGAPARLPIR